MKLFSILNKPTVKANNKQAGIVFLEYVIIAFIITVAVICAMWWFYWHLQQKTWEVKQKLDVLKTMSCELTKPYGTTGEQPTPQPSGVTYEFTINGLYIIPEIPYPNQEVAVKNLGPDGFWGTINFLDQAVLGTNGQKVISWLGPGETITFEYNHDDYGQTGPYNILSDLSGVSGTDYTLTVIPLP